MQHNSNSLNIPWRNYMYMRLMQFLWFNIVLGPHICKYVHFDQILYIHHSYHQRQSEKKIQFKENNTSSCNLMIFRLNLCQIYTYMRKLVLSSETIRFKTCFEQSTYFCCKFSLTRYDIFFSSHWLYWLLRFGFKDTHLKCALIQLIVLGFCISTVIVHIFFLTCPLHFLNTKTKTKQKSTTN